MKKEFGEYFIGLDIGTDSLGWAVTDLNYNLQKLNGKTLWGIRLFEAGKTAEERRVFRTARRRLERRKQRLRLLQAMFAEEICKVDPGFFQRLAESKYYPEDKSFDLPYSLFSDSKFTDKDYHRNFPTIFHLRQALLEKTDKFDIRLVYLALHHIIKNRGHFLFEGQNMESISSFEEVFRQLQQVLRDELELELDCKSVTEVEEILKARQIRKTDKKNQLNELFYANSKEPEAKQKQAFISLMIGSPANLSALFPDKSFEEAEVTKIDFSGSKYEEEYDKLANILEDRIFCIDKLKAIYDWALLADIRQGYKFLSQSKSAVYDKHKYDLKILKAVVKKLFADKYKDVFARPDLADNYCAYIGMTKKNNRKIPVNKRCMQEDFYKFVSGILKTKTPGNEDLQYILKEIENKSFLPKQITKDNSVIPYQMHMEELRGILQNASRHFHFLEKKDETGLSIQEKIEKLMCFRIPYYVGPINDSHKDKGGNCWVVKRISEPVRPWNFEKVVDLDKSAEGFIKRMTNKCTYIVGADVLPKNSLLYSEFTVLNELNNLKINGEGISVELKRKIFTELFMKYKKVTQKRLKSFLENEGVISKHDEISGIDEDFKSSLTSYCDFREVLGEKSSNVAMIEDLIRWIVLFGEDSKLLKHRIAGFYGKELSDSEIKRILKLKYTGWGRLSKELLTTITHADRMTGECISIISALRGDLGENFNLMQLLGGGFDYSAQIDAHNARLTNECDRITYEMVKELYVSPAVKRGIWQTLQIVMEVGKIMQHPPKKIFVEVAREEGEKKRTQSRKSLLIDLYKSCRNEGRDWAEELAAVAEADLRSDRLYLYYTQMGRCMYSGEPINLSCLYDKNIYDVDHIYPQSKVKDDSLENRVLVKRTINSEKSDSYPLPKKIQEQNAGLWRDLYNKSLIGKKKYDRLTRVNPFDDGELADFIARQLVETRQSSKAVAEILKQTFPKTEIVYVKAGNVSDFRQKFELVKVREINDYHHAKDAFLNIVVGNVYNTKFTHSPVNFIKKFEGKSYNLRRMYDFPVERNGEIAWRTGDGNTISQVKTVMQRNNILFTRHALEQKGGLFDQNILKKGGGQLSVKSSDPKLTIDKYGGYNKVAGAYFMLVEHVVSKGKKTQTIRSLEFVPVYLANQFEKSDSARIDYCKNALELVNPKILLPKVKSNTLFDVAGFKMHLSGRTGGERLLFKGANQLVLGSESEVYFKKLVKYLDHCREAKKDLPVTPFDKLSVEKNIEIYDAFLTKLENTVYRKRLESQIKTVKEGRSIFLQLAIPDQCKVLEQILYLFRCSPVSADLSKIGGPKNAGVLVLSKNISNCEAISVINQSATGVFEQKIDLLKI